MARVVRLAVPVMEPREYKKAVGSTSGEKWSSRSTDSPTTAKDAVWRRWALKRGAVNASETTMWTSRGCTRRSSDEAARAMRQALAASSARVVSASSSARNLKPRVGISREDSTEVSSRMEDVLPSRERGSEEVRLPDGSDPPVAGCGTEEFQTDRIVLQGQVWRYSYRHGLRAWLHSGLCDRLVHG